MVADARKRLAENPNRADLHDQLGVLLRARGNARGAMAEIRAAVRLAPREPHYYGDLGSVQQEAGLPADALKSFQTAARLARGSREKEWAPVYTWQSAQSLESLGRLHEAERWYEIALAQMSAYRPDWLTSGMDRRTTAGDFGAVIRRSVGVSGFEERPRRDDEDAHRPSAPEIPKRSDVTHREHQAEPRLRHAILL